MGGQSVILQAPTGAGKTRAALAPFLQNLANDGDKLPLTCRYAVPLRILASQFFKEYESYGQKIDLQMDTRLIHTYSKFGQEPVQIQTGEQPNDPQFESALTFCTIDQLLASAIGIPYSVGRRRANLNVGAILSSYLVFDEFHLFPLEQNLWGARTTTLEMLELTRLGARQRLTPFVMMTATFSTTLLEQLAILLGATVVRIEDEGELQELNEERKRTFHLHDSPMTPSYILDAHHDSSLVVCNTVLRSQQIYKGIRDLVRREGRSTRVLLLHSRFTDDDRRWLETEIAQEVGKDAWQQKPVRDIIIVATQVVEVGLDISVMDLHSEIAPANSIVQRAGRCARFAGQQGHVHLYALSPDTSYAPYTKSVCDATFTAFAQYDNQHVGFGEEQIVIDAVHKKEDEQLLKQFGVMRDQIRHHIVESLATNKRGFESRLIRNVAQVSILIHEDPKTTITERPWEWQSFSFHPSSFASTWPMLEEAWKEANEDSHFCYKPIAYEEREQNKDMDHEEGERIQTRYTWDAVNTPELIQSGALPLIVLHPALATYDSPAREPYDQDAGLGFVLNDGRLPYSWSANHYRSSIRPAYEAKTMRGQRGYDGYEQESYVEHVRGLYQAYIQSRLQSELGYVATILESVLGLPPKAIDQAVRLAIACHDIGKLNTDWQRWCELWQDLLVEKYPNQVVQFNIKPEKRPFAHTDNNGSRAHFELQREVRRRHKISRPHHACESAQVACYFIEQTLAAGCTSDDAAQKLARATVAAIARHHAPQSQEYGSLRLCTDGLDAIAGGIMVVRQGQNWTYDLSTIESTINIAGKRTLAEDQMTLPERDNITETLLYYLLVRVLRLADARSFRYKH
jgi:CRISPR-associated endonuclease/helicase Cas3